MYKDWQELAQLCTNFLNAIAKLKDLKLSILVFNASEYSNSYRVSHTKQRRVLGKVWHNHFPPKDNETVE